MILLLAGCMSMDGFFFSPELTDAYTLANDLIPAESVEEIAFTTDDGLTLAGVWAWQADATNAPTILQFHGNKGHIDEHWGRTGVFWSYGYNVFVFDYRGYGKSEGKPDHDGVIADGAAALALVEETTGLAAEDLFFHGVSLGGYVGLNTALAAPPKALITEDLFSSGENLIEANTTVNLPREWLLDGEFDTMARAAEFDAGVPWLIIHGDSDTYVKVEHAQWLYASANEPKELWLVPGGNHGPVVDSLRHYELVPEEYEAHITGWFAE